VKSSCSNLLETSILQSRSVIIVGAKGDLKMRVSFVLDSRCQWSIWITTSTRKAECCFAIPAIVTSPGFLSLDGCQFPSPNAQYSRIASTVLTHRLNLKYGSPVMVSPCVDLSICPLRYRTGSISGWRTSAILDATEWGDTAVLRSLNSRRSKVSLSGPVGFFKSPKTKPTSV